MMLTHARTALAVLLVGSAVAGCTSTGKSHSTHASATAAGPQAGMDMKAMCERHRQMMAAPSAQRQAMMEERMKSMGMTPEAMQKHMQEMAERCK